jgi:hypothetical protein
MFTTVASLYAYLCFSMIYRRVIRSGPYQEPFVCAEVRHNVKHI